MNAPDNHRPDHRTEHSPMKRSDPPTHRQLEQRARELYRAACQHIDPTTAAQLRAARRQALAAAQLPQHRVARWLIPTGAFAVLTLAALMVWQPTPHGPAASSNLPTQRIDSSADLDNELPPDADKIDLNLYQNLDFYGWLAANDSQPAHR